MIDSDSAKHAPQGLPIKHGIRIFERGPIFPPSAGGLLAAVGPFVALVVGERHGTGEQSTSRMTALAAVNLQTPSRSSNRQCAQPHGGSRSFSHVED